MYITASTAKGSSSISVPKILDEGEDSSGPTMSSKSQYRLHLLQVLWNIIGKAVSTPKHVMRYTSYVYCTILPWARFLPSPFWNEDLCEEAAYNIQYIVTGMLEPLKIDMTLVMNAVEEESNLILKSMYYNTTVTSDKGDPQMLREMMRSNWNGQVKSIWRVGLLHRVACRFQVWKSPKKWPICSWIIHCDLINRYCFCCSKSISPESLPINLYLSCTDKQGKRYKCNWVA